MPVNQNKPGKGWLRDLPDFRDLSVDSAVAPSKLAALGQKPVKEMLRAAGVGPKAAAKLPATADLRQWCSPIEDQGNIGSCTAHAGVGMVEYFERRASGKHVDASRRFLYKVTRNFMQVTGDTGAYLRSTMGALTLFGVPPESYWAYDEAKYEEEPPAFCYAFAQNYQAVSYYRLDPPGAAADVVLGRIKTNLAAGLPSMFGFTVYSSISQADKTGRIPFPTTKDAVDGGHAIMAVGYDDAMKIKNVSKGGVETKGALLIRNSWSAGWGEKGYGWLPYDYVLRGLAVDWWSLLKGEWVDTGEFKV